MIVEQGHVLLLLLDVRPVHRFAAKGIVITQKPMLLFTRQ